MGETEEARRNAEEELRARHEAALMTRHPVTEGWARPGMPVGELRQWLEMKEGITVEGVTLKGCWPELSGEKSSQWFP